jgi:hypothetical protein
VNTYGYLDLVPKGRDEGGLPFTMSWVRHHDCYEDGYLADADRPYWPAAAPSVSRRFERLKLVDLPLAVPVGIPQVRSDGDRKFKGAICCESLALQSIDIACGPVRLRTRGMIRLRDANLYRRVPLTLGQRVAEY